MHRTDKDVSSCRLVTSDSVRANPADFNSEQDITPDTTTKESSFPWVLADTIGSLSWLLRIPLSSGNTRGNNGNKKTNGAVGTNDKPTQNCMLRLKPCESLMTSLISLNYGRWLWVRSYKSQRRSCFFKVKYRHLMHRTKFWHD